MELIIEEISRGNKLIGRHKYLQNSIMLGRNYQNDIIISDPHVCPEHLSFHFQDGQWFVTDMNSVNGSFLNHEEALPAQYAIKSGDIISFGKSQIRVILPSHQVAETIKFSPVDSLIKLCANPFILIANILLFTTIVGFINYSNIHSPLSISQAIVPALAMTLGVCFWPLVFALIAHLTKHEARVFTQLGITFAIVNLFWLVEGSELLLSFNLSSKWSLNWFFVATGVLLLFSLFWFNLFVAFNQSHKRRLIVASSLTIILVTGNYLVQMSKAPDFDYQAHYSTTLMSPQFKFTSSSSVDSFISDADKLFEKNKKQIQKAKKDQQD